MAITPSAPHDDSVDPLIETADEIADMMLAGTLPKPRWSHEGHVLACLPIAP